MGTTNTGQQRPYEENVPQSALACECLEDIDLEIEKIYEKPYSSKSASRLGELRNARQRCQRNAGAVGNQE